MLMVGFVPILSCKIEDPRFDSTRIGTGTGFSISRKISSQFNFVSSSGGCNSFIEASATGKVIEVNSGLGGGGTVPILSCKIEDPRFESSRIGSGLGTTGMGGMGGGVSLML